MLIINANNGELSVADFYDNVVYHIGAIRQSQ